MKKKITAYILVTFLIAGSVLSSYKKPAYAFEGGIIAGSLLTGPAGLVAVCLVAGVCATAYIVDNYDDIKTSLETASDRFSAWFDKVTNKRQIDVNDPAFEIVKEYAHTNLVGQGLPSSPSGNGNTVTTYEGVDVLTLGQLGYFSKYYAYVGDEGQLFFFAKVGATYTLFSNKSFSQKRSGTVYGRSTQYGTYNFHYLTVPQSETTDYALYTPTGTTTGEKYLDSYNFLTSFINADSNAGGSYYGFPVETGDVYTVVGTGSNTGIIDIPAGADVIGISEGIEEGTIDYVNGLTNIGAVSYLTRDGITYRVGVDNALIDVNDSGTTDISGYTALGLENYFPFCIPFDLYNLLSAFSAEPEAPCIEWTFEYFGESTTIELDLSAWDSVAAVMRTLLICLFIAGLAIKTRDLIRG